MGPDGTIYLITLVFDRPALEGVSVQVAVSHDVGTTWKWSRLSATRLDDRPWIEVAPDAPREQVEAAALAESNVAHFLAGLSVKKVIVVPGKIVNIVAA